MGKSVGAPARKSALKVLDAKTPRPVLRSLEQCSELLRNCALL